MQHWLADGKDVFVNKTYLTNRAKAYGELKFTADRGRCYAKKLGRSMRLFDDDHQRICCGGPGQPRRED
jgi:hypothetical protein